MVKINLKAIKCIEFKLQIKMNLLRCIIASPLFLVTLILILIGFVHIINRNSKKLVNLTDHPFECGIGNKSSTRKSYSLPFFFITLLFLIFDLEIILIFFIIFFKIRLTFFLFYLLVIFFFLFSLILEWFYGSLVWIKI